VPEDEPVRDAAGGHLAEARVDPDPRPIGVRERGQATHPRLDPAVDPLEEDAQRQRSVALDHADPQRVLGSPPEGHRRFPVAVHHPLELTEPERQHLDHVGEHLARSPRRLGFRAERRRQLPWLPGGDAWPQPCVGVASGLQPIQILGHGRQCGTTGVR
jgi:hypothetical protein